MPKASADGAASDAALKKEIEGKGVTLEDLASEALAAREMAYVPHSGFKVGAAVLTSTGRVYRGCNIESASYPLTHCAERTAIHKAVSEGDREIIAVAVAGDASYLHEGAADEAAEGAGTGGAGQPGPRPTGLNAFVTPCGACRQIIFEFGPEAKVLLVDLEGGRHLTSARELLPGGFRLEGFQG